jgi:hypothetical protein
MPTRSYAAAIVPPKGGWLKKTYYVVNVSYGPNNPSHKAILYTGFLDLSGNPGSYARIFSGSYGRLMHPSEAASGNAVEEIGSMTKDPGSATGSAR